MTIVDHPIRLAVVDDDDVYRRYLRGLLSRRGSFEISEASSGDELEVLVARHTIDCVLLDYNLGDVSGLAVKERLDRHGSLAPPVIMLTGDGRERTVIKALRLGVSDYLSKKDMRIEELVSAIGRSVERRRRERSTALGRERLEKTAEIDLASGLYSRTYLDKRLEKLLGRSIAIDAPFSLIVIELVQLRSIGSTFGVAAEDRALRSFADRLRSEVRPGDVCGRLSADSFAWIVDGQESGRRSLEICRDLDAHLSFEVEDATANFRLSARVTHMSLSALAGLAPLAILAAAEAAIADVDSPAARLADDDAQASVTSSDAVTTSVRNGDRRSEARQRVLKRAQIVLSNLHSTIECVVRNVSPGGASIRLHSVFALPAEFELEIVGSGRRRRVRSCWQNGTDIGMKFAD